MGFRQFSTKSADYVLELMPHSQEFSTSHLLDTDAIIYEFVRKPTSSSFQDMSGKRRSELVYEHCKERKKPVFITDNASESIIKADMAWEDGEFSIDVLPLLRIAILTATIMPICKVAERQGEVSDVVSWMISAYQYMLHDPLVEGRNAISSRKIEEFVAPYMQAALNRRPKIGMIYGTGHAGIEYDLKSRHRRNLAIRNALAFSGNEFDSERLGMVYEVRFENRDTRVIEHNSSLFC